MALFNEKIISKKYKAENIVFFTLLFSYFNEQEVNKFGKTYFS
jgi:hypothetical protein